MKIVFATGNENKLREIREILGEDATSVVSMREAGVAIEIVENGSTFEENALIKARAVQAALPESFCDAVVLADDSGLEVDALGGEPGVYSARYLGEDTPYEVKNAEILSRLADVPREKRTARFVCAVAAAFPDGGTAVVRDTIEGNIGYEPRGQNGFGYDPIFYLPDFSASTAQLLPEEKNAISHRGKALRRMRDLLFDKS